MAATIQEHEVPKSSQATAGFCATLRLPLVGRFLLAAVFILAGVVKIIDPIGFARAIADYDLLPDRIVPVVAVVLPWWEVAAGVFAISGRWRIPSLTVLTGLSAVFLIVGTITFARGLSAECGCFGFLSERVGPASIGFEALLLAVGGLLLWREFHRVTSCCDGARLVEVKHAESKTAVAMVTGGGQPRDQVKAGRDVAVTNDGKSQLRKNSNPKEIPIMNDPIKYLITGAAIAIVCGAAGTFGGVWIMKDASGPRLQVRSQGPTANVKPPPISIQPASFNGQPPMFNGQPSVFNGQRIQQNPGITIPPRPVNGSNVAFRPTSPTGKPPMTYSQFQKLQDAPEVKAAREAFMEAQKKYSDTMKKAVESGHGAVASTSKATPLTIQISPAGSGTNGTAKGRL